MSDSEDTDLPRKRLRISLSSADIEAATVLFASGASTKYVSTVVGCSIRTAQRLRSRIEPSLTSSSDVPLYQPKKRGPKPSRPHPMPPSPSPSGDGAHHDDSWSLNADSRQASPVPLNMCTNEFFKDFATVKYDPKAGPEATLVFKHYNADEVVHGRRMEDWLRFSVVYWHTFRGTGLDPFGVPTLIRPWDDGTESLENAKRRLRASFEFFQKLGVKYWSFHDRDVAPEGATLDESNRNLDEIVDLALDLQQQTGVRLLWATCNLFAHPRYMNGASTNPDAHVFAYAAAQVKKGLEIAKKLNAENYVFWGGREGYHSLLNSDIKAELDHMASFFRMVVAYKQKIGFTGQLLIEPKPKEPSKHQYDYDAMTVIAFLKTYGLDQHFKLNVEPNHTTLAGHAYEHDVIIASKYGMLGSIDANTGSPDLGWDTDQFPMDIRNCTILVKAIIDQGGLQPGGLNFDAKVRRESTDIADMFIAHIGGMDALARGLRNAVKIIEDGVLQRLLNERYVSYKSDIGARIEKGEATLEECEEYVRKHGEPKKISGKQEHFESILNYYLH